MQTNGPIRDYALYANLNQRRYLRPESPGETLESAIQTYRLYFKEICQLSLVPSLLVSGFFTCFTALLLPRLFKTTFSDNTSLQVVEFILVLFGGLTIGFVAAALGLSRIAVICHTIADLQFRNQSMVLSEIERASFSMLLRTFATLIRTFFFVILPFAVSMIPILICGLLLAVTSSKDALLGVAGILCLLIVPIGAVWSLTRLSTGIGAISVSLTENKRPKEAVLRTRYLFGSKSKPPVRSNPVVTSIINSLILYLILRSGYSGADQIIGFSDFVLKWFKNPIANQTVELALSILPEFIAIWLLIPFISLTGAMFYHQRRIVVEGLDIKTLYDELPANRR
jgi:hypothetical protein